MRYFTFGCCRKLSGPQRVGGSKGQNVGGKIEPVQSRQNNIKFIIFSKGH